MTTMNGGGDDNNSNNEHNKQHSQQQPQIDDAKNFLERVKEAFKNKKGVYDRFVEIMKNFKHDRLNTGGVIKEVQDLFAGHDDLFIGFQNFLPAAGLVTQDELRQTMQNITDSVPPNMRGNGHNTMGNTDTSNSAPPDFNMAVTFICKIKRRFGSHRRIYQEFLQILQHFQTAAQANDTSVIKDVKMRIRALFRDHPDLLDQFDYFLPPLTAHFSRNQSAAQANGSADNNGASNGRNSRKRRADSDLDNQPDAKRRRQDEDGTERKRRGRKPRNSNHNDDAWQPSGGTTGDHSTNTRSKKHRQSSRHRRKEKQGSDDDDDEITFSDGDIESDSGNKKSKAEVIAAKEVVAAGDEHQGLRIFSKLRKDIPDHLYKHVLTLTQLYPMGLTEFSVVGKLICDALREHGHSELMKEFQKELQSSKQSWFFRSRGQNYYEYLTNNILLKSCKAVQSSYRQLPPDVVQPRCSGRHPDAAETLNDYFVSKPTGGEGNQQNGETAGGRLKSIYNENLQKSEDDLFELDMMIETNDAARKRLEQLYKTVMQPKNVKHMIANQIEIPPVEKRAISRLYSEHGNKVLNLLKKMPETTIPVVLKRLREKSNEWQTLKNEMKIVWKSVANKNYFKAHDYRYTIFKQYDMKRITTKNICKQIEERHLVQKRARRCNTNGTTKQKRFEERKIAAYNANGGGIISNGNGVVSGVGLIGNASHDHIIQQMGAGLVAEVGDYCSLKHPRIDNNDYRFVIGNRNVLRDCARFVFQHANTAEVGQEKKEKKLFAEILENIFNDLFAMNIKEQSTEFLQNDVDSDSDDDTKMNNSNNTNNTTQSNSNSPEPISKIMRKMEIQNETELENMKLNAMDSNQINQHLSTYFVENEEAKAVVIYGNKTIYALFRYLHCLYARMHFAFTLCDYENPLYGRPDSDAQIHAKYKDFLSHLSKLINGQIEEEIFEDECRKLLGIKAYQLFTIHRVIQKVYHTICDFDTDEKLHRFYKLFLRMNANHKVHNKEERSKYFVTASRIANSSNNQKSKMDQDMYQIQYFNNHNILTISLCDKYIPIHVQQPQVAPQPSPPQQHTPHAIDEPILN
eukprot:64560_1